MNSSGAWTTNTDELLKWQLLSWLDEQTVPESDTRQFIVGTEYTEDQVIAVVRGFVAQGWRRPSSRRLSSGPASIALSVEGKAAARELADNRQQRGPRAVAAQEALLDWVYDDECRDKPRQPNPESFVGDNRAHYYGDPFAKSEILTAAAALYQLGQITGVRSHGIAAPARLQLTAKGRETVQRGGTLHPEQPIQSNVYNNQFYDNVGAVAQGTNFKQVANIGIDADDLAAAFRAVQDAIGLLTAEDQLEATHQLVVIQDEAKDGFDDPSIVQKKFTRLKSLGAKTGNAAFMTAVSQLGVLLVKLITG